MLLTIQNFKKRIEFSLCQQFATVTDVENFCQLAREINVGVVCLNPVNVAQASQILKGENIEISGNVGFPFGSHAVETKVMETEQVVKDGATQIDVVINVGALKSGQDNKVFDDIRAVVNAAGARPVKCIIETWVLSPEEITRACILAEEAGAHMIKTTTGVKTQYIEKVNPGARGSVIEEIVLIRKTLKKNTRIKASGGIYSLEDALAMIEAGADQLGASKGEELIRKFSEKYPHGLEIERK